MTAAPDTLQAVTVVADRGVVVSRRDTVSVDPMQGAGEALLQFPGIYVGDYGGFSGLKSASLRGFGSAHTALYVDGVRVGNVQSGQADLGMLGLPSMGSIVADYAQNSLSFNTLKPVFRGRPVAGTVRNQLGSFGTWQPFARLDFRLGERTSLSVHGAGLMTKGAFPLEDGTLWDHNDMRQLQAGIDLFGRLSGGEYHAKLFYNNADRGTPGSLSWPSEDRQLDKNYLAQGVLRKAFGPYYTLNLSAKAAYDDLSYQGGWGQSLYKQTEFQLNSAHKFRVLPWWTVSLAADAAWDGLRSDLYNESRLSGVAALASAIRLARLQIDLALEYAGVWDKGGASWNSLSPSAGLRFTLLEGVDLVAFGRRAYRTPTFNELYYPGYGNPQLKPEDAYLADVGLDITRKWGGWTWKGRVDGFYNYLTNKIVSGPSEDPAVWLPYNIGKVQAFGADLLSGFEYAAGPWKAGFQMRYGWQQALDKTPDSYSYGEQIPYVARRSAGFQAQASWKGWGLEAAYQQRMGRQDATGEMPDWNTLDLGLGKDFHLGKAGVLGLRVKARNLTDCRYELIRDYPMPGRSFVGGISYSF